MKVKIGCGAIGCTRYRTIGYTEGQVTVYLCRPHWMGLPKAQRLEMNKAFRECDADPSHHNCRKVAAL